MGVSVAPEYSPDNPFAGKQYSPDNPFAGPKHNRPKIGQMGHAITTEEDPSDGPPGVGTKVLGVLAALNRDIPGAEAAQAGIRSVIRGQSYSQARDDIRGAEDAAPTAAVVPARLLGGGLSAVAGGRAFGLGAKGAGALYGGLSGLGDSAPMSKDDRVGQGIGGAVVGGLAGYAGQKAAGLAGKVARPVMRGLSSVAQQVAASAPGVAKNLEGLVMPPEVLRPGSEAVANVVANARQSALGSRLQSVLEAVKAKNAGQGIHEVGNLWGDAEEAMGLAPHQQPDLEELLRRSLKMKPKVIQ